MRQFGCVRGRRLYFSLTHRSACPAVRPSIQIGGASWQGSNLSFPSLLFTEAARRTGKADIAVKREIDVARCLGWQECDKNQTDFAVPLVSSARRRRRPRRNCSFFLFPRRPSTKKGKHGGLDTDVQRHELFAPISQLNLLSRYSSETSLQREIFVSETTRLSRYLNFRSIINWKI